MEQPQLLIVSDIDDMFIPLSDGFLVSPIQSKFVNFVLDSFH